MSTEEKSLNFIEQIIENSLETGFPKDKLRFRFPPEPNGYLHIGHAKSICLNFGLGIKYNAPVNLRFDDTNPTKEEQEYVDSIKEDIKWLGFCWENELYASDYFQQLYEWAVLMIKNNKAYVDNQTAEEIAAQKGTPSKPGIESPFRNRSVEENLELFEKMKNGDFPEGSYVLRAKIDMSSSNMLMRDPLIYRILKRPHHRTGNKWNIYPMYDFAHGQSDYIESISHSICTLEFVMHRELYEWFLEQISDTNKVIPKQYEFARLNLNYTVMSKRKLLQLVNNKIVNGWDDPRMPTISALRRRGYTANSIRHFCNIIGVAKRENIIDISLLEFCLREDLNKIAPRVMAVIDPIKLIITNYPDNKEEYLQAENNPEDENAGFRKIPFSRELYIEKEDFMEIAPEKFFRLSIGKEVRLKNAYIIKAEKVIKDSDNNILEIHTTYDENSCSGSGESSQRKVSATLHWVSAKHSLEAEVRLYDRLFLDEAPDSHKEKDFTTFINPNSLKMVKAFVEPSLKISKPGDIFQFQRLGYFNVDKDSTESKLVFNRTVSLKDFWEEKGKKENNLLVNTQKDINRFVKETDAAKAELIFITIAERIKSVDNFSLLVQAVEKNIKNDANSLLFSNLILKFADIINISDIDYVNIHKFFKMSLRCQLYLVRLYAIENIKKDENIFLEYKNIFSEMKETEKNEKVLQLLKF